MCWGFVSLSGVGLDRKSVLRVASRRCVLGRQKVQNVDRWSEVGWCVALMSTGGRKGGEGDTRGPLKVMVMELVAKALKVDAFLFNSLYRLKWSLNETSYGVSAAAV